jgi:uncharacterized protein (TIGR02300 family)
VTKPEWGTKRSCQSCNAKFYDFRRSPITCPKCGSEFVPDSLAKSRRGRGTAVAKAPRPEVVAAAGEAKPEIADLEIDELPEDDDDDSVIVDTSDLDGGDEEVTKVVVSSDDED